MNIFSSIKSYKIFIHTVFLLFITASALAQNDNVTREIINIGQTDNQTMDHLDVISNRFGGRLVGSDAYENAAEWGASQFKQAV